MYLLQILQKYQPRDLSSHDREITSLHKILKTWASTCYIEIIKSGSMAKGTAISIASDVDYLISLASNCNENSGGLGGIYDSLYSKLTNSGYTVRQQNISFKINLNELEVDVIPFPQINTALRSNHPPALREGRNYKVVSEEGSEDCITTSILHNDFLTPHEASKLASAPPQGGSD